MRSIQNLKKLPLWSAIFFLLVTNTTASFANGNSSSQVIATVGNREITSTELEQLLVSSPIGTQFNTMDEGPQAMIRGRMAKNLIYSEMLYLEGLAQKIDLRQEVKDELNSFRQNLLYQRYLLSLRASLETSQEDARIKEQMKDSPEALAAARSVNSSGKFLKIRAEETIKLGKKDHLLVHQNLLALGNRDPETVVARGDHVKITLGDLIYGDVSLQTVDPETLLDRLDREVEHRLMSLAAEQQGIDVSEQLNVYKRDLIRQIVMKEREKRWVPDRASIETYYREHPEMSRIAELMHIGQLVVSTKEEAEDLRQRILAGESLFKLASEKSIDPYGRQNAGDMGWLRPDQAPESIRATLQDLADNTISPVISTERGYYLITILGRKPASQKPLNSVLPGIRRSMILAHISEDYIELSKKYPVKWNLPEHITDNN